MASESKEFIVRRPRHEAVKSEACRVWLELNSRKPAILQEAELVDMSRHGLRVRLLGPLELEELATARIQTPDGKLDLTLAGQVRWQRREADGSWSVGCIFKETVGYEILGELFLRGILSTD